MVTEAVKIVAVVGAAQAALTVVVATVTATVTVSVVAVVGSSYLLVAVIVLSG